MTWILAFIEFAFSYKHLIPFWSALIFCDLKRKWALIFICLTCDYQERSKAIRKGEIFYWTYPNKLAMIFYFNYFSLLIFVTSFDDTGNPENRLINSQKLGRETNIFINIFHTKTMKKIQFFKFHSKFCLSTKRKVWNLTNFPRRVL